MAVKLLNQREKLIFPLSALSKVAPIQLGQQVFFVKVKIFF